MLVRRKRHQKGSVALDRRSKTWFFRWWAVDPVTNKRTRKAERIGTQKEFPTKSSAKQAAEPLQLRLNKPEISENTPVTLEQVAERYIRERMPQRHSTSRGYRGKLKIIRQAWGSHAMPLKPFAIELWLKNLKNQQGESYSAKTKSHLRNMLFGLHEAAMFFELLPIERNPISLVQVKGAGKRSRELTILTMEDFRRLLTEIPEEPYHLMVLLAGCLGLRTSEIFALQWADFDWLRNEVYIQRAIVEGFVDEVKTLASRRRLPLDSALTAPLLAWKQQTPFSADSDFVFASPVMLGKKPLSSNSAQRDVLRPASIRAGLQPIGWHALRHSYRTWLDEIGTGPMVQKELMRHSTITMTLDTYGRGVPAANREANARLVGQLLQ